MIKRIMIAFYAGLLLVASCKNKPEESFQPKYYDLKNYFEKEASTMLQQNFLLKKSITKDEETESKVFTVVDWKSELTSFMECDINRQAWLNSYRIDSSEIGKTILVKYTAIDSSLKVKTIQLYFENGQPFSVQILKKTDKQFFDHFTYLNFMAGKYYSIDDWQKINFAKSIRIKIEAIFIKK